jgi:hypothetical protein
MSAEIHRFCPNAVIEAENLPGGRLDRTPSLVQPCGFLKRRRLGGQGWPGQTCPRIIKAGKNGVGRYPRASSDDRRLYGGDHQRISINQPIGFDSHALTSHLTPDYQVYPLS